MRSRISSFPVPELGGICQAPRRFLAAWLMMFHGERATPGFHDYF